MKIGPKQFLVCFNAGSIFNPHNSWTSGEPCFYTVSLDESLYDEPDYHFLQKYYARLKLWKDLDETGNNELGEEDLDYKPSKEQFKKCSSELHKLHTILREVWARAVGISKGYVGTIAYIVHLGHNEMRHEWFYPQSEDWANLGDHEAAESILAHHFDRYQDWLLHKDEGIDEDGHPVTETTEEDWEKFYKEWNESFPWDKRQIGDDKDYSKFGKKK